jgi:magnesium transporter
VPPLVVVTTLVRSASVWRAAALAIPDVGLAVFFIGGTLAAVAGAAAPWYVLAAVGVAVACRTLDIEGWGIPVRGGLVGRAGEAYGPRGAAIAAAGQLLERVVFASLMAMVFGRYLAALPVWLFVPANLWPTYLKAGDLGVTGAMVLLGFAWIRARLGLASGPHAIRRTIIAATALVAIVVASFVTALAAGMPLRVVPAPTLPSHNLAGWLTALATLAYVFEQALASVGSGDSLARAAGELEPPRTRGIRRTLVVLLAFGVIVTFGAALLFVSVVPPDQQRTWSDVPLLGIIEHVRVPGLVKTLLTVTIAAIGALLLGQGVRAGISGGERMLVQLSEQGRLTRALALPHASLGTLARASDTAAAVSAVAIVTSAGRVDWLAQAYGACLAWTLLLKVAVLLPLRQSRTDAPFRVPLNPRVGSHEWPLGVLGIAALVGVPLLAALVLGNAPAIAASAAMAGVAMVVAVSARRLPPVVEESDPLRLVTAQAPTLDHVTARPGGILVPVRNPHSLAHLSQALAAANGRDVIVMTVRLIGLDGDDDDPHAAVPTANEQALFAKVLATAERLASPVRLLLMPAHNVFDATVAAIGHLRPSDVFVGESSTLSADTQARLLGDAWEKRRANTPQGVRLVVVHQSGRRETFHIGAHAPTLNSRDLDLIHAVWLDATKTLGPHIHHHDVVRAALTQMSDQLKGPDRDQALRAIDATARPGEELAVVVRTRDYAALRDMMRNRPPEHLAALLNDLTVEDQVVVFRLLPRKDAAAVFEYLSLEQQEVLLKAMAQEDVASLLNEMSPDDRTMFLEELPAPVTRQLLALLTPEERTIASTLLGYPEDSVGRLMTPEYIAVREDWTIQQVLDFIRTHGQDSETLNVIYVVDAAGHLIDDLRIRELLLAPPAKRVAELIDRRWVSLKATDDQSAAIAAFRAHDRTALPVTDTTGVLIGIVTIDDVLHVVEERTTEDIQLIGGSEALDEPYMVISFPRMIRKRAGWLTALFVPLIISSGGNSGSQASTLVIRALALGELTLRDWWRVARREIGAGLALGGILGSIGFLRIAVWSAFSTLYGPHWLLVAVTVSVALVGIVLWGTLVGALLPFVLRRLGFDPATSSAPFVATLVDVTGLIIYFTVALVVLRGTLL